jgi:tetratricopeptide (TPR) repeat protein
MTAETEYLFRHALVQQAAYSLQLPSERGALHGLVVEIFHRLLPGDQLDAHALELAGHAGLAAAGDAAFESRQLELLRTGEKWAGRNYRLAERVAALAAIADHPLAAEPERERANMEKGGALRMLGRHPEAEQVLEAAIKTHDAMLRAQALNQLAAVYLRTGRPAEALRSFTRAHDIFEQSGDARMLARVLGNVALVQFELHQRDACAATLDRAAKAAEAAGDISLKAQVHGHRARLYHHGARLDEAEAEYHKAIALAQEAGDRGTHANAASNLAELQRHRGKPDARERMTTALRLAREVGDRYLEMMTLGNYGLLLKWEGQLDDARRTLELAYAMALELGDRLTSGFTLSNLANLHHSLGNVEACNAAAAGALQVARELKSLRLEAIIHLARGDRNQSRSDLQRAVELARQAGDELIRQDAELSLQELGDGSPPGREPR